MALLNVLTGSFSVLAGLWKAIAEKAPWPIGDQATTANPWMYVIGGSICTLTGVGNGHHFSLATWGTIIFIATSIYDGWFASGSKDWRFYTLNLYVVVQTLLVLWSTQYRSLLAFP